MRADDANAMRDRDGELLAIELSVGSEVGHE
jgi:hypothetical protein